MRTRQAALAGPHGCSADAGKNPMGSFSIWYWMLLLVVFLLLFGRGKISKLMGDFAQGIKSFKSGGDPDGFV
jgi:TatA/E family protein of Tat protein translocase